MHYEVNNIDILKLITYAFIFSYFKFKIFEWLICIETNFINYLLTNGIFDVQLSKLPDMQTLFPFPLQRNTVGNLGLSASFRLTEDKAFECSSGTFKKESKNYCCASICFLTTAAQNTIPKTKQQQFQANIYQQELESSTFYTCKKLIIICQH